MTVPPRKLMRAIAKAAELRTFGLNWEQIGDKLHRSADTVRKWPSVYRDYWQQLVNGSRSERDDEAGDEALAVLRSLLRSENDKIRLNSAKLLLKLREETKTNAAATAKASEWDAFMEHLEGLSDDDLRTFFSDNLRQYLERLIPHRNRIAISGRTQGPEHLC
jgi:phytoene dehydrogenase-like protein